MKELVTPRLRLCPISLREAGRVAAGVPGDGSVWAPGYPAVADIIAVGGFLEHCTWAGNPHPFGYYQLVRRVDGLAIGGAGFHGPPDPLHSVTVGYGVIAPARGRGYAREALSALLSMAGAAGVLLVRGTADRANDASQRVMAGAGMRLVAEDAGQRHYEIGLAG